MGYADHLRGYRRLPVGHGELEDALGAYGKRVVETFEEAAKENDRLWVFFPLPREDPD